MLNGFESLDEKRRENPSYVKRRSERTERCLRGVYAKTQEGKLHFQVFSTREAFGRKAASENLIRLRRNKERRAPFAAKIANVLIL